MPRKTVRSVEQGAHAVRLVSSIIGSRNLIDLATPCQEKGASRQGDGRLLIGTQASDAPKKKRSGNQIERQRQDEYLEPAELCTRAKKEEHFPNNPRSWNADETEHCRPVCV